MLFSPAGRFLSPLSKIYLGMEPKKKRPDPHAECQRLLASIERKLKDRFEQIYSVRYSPGTKGAGYERVLADFLREYLGGVFEINTRVALLDRDLKVFSLFSPKENEFDVVATFKISSPRIILETEGMRYIPYDAVAFLVEVGQTLDKSKLEHDLGKLSRVSLLAHYGLTGAVRLSSNHAVERPLRILFYHEREVSWNVLVDLLRSSSDCWDLLFVVREGLLLVNRATLPLVRRYSIGADTIAICRDYPLLHLLLLIQASLPKPFFIDTAFTLINLMRMAKEGDPPRI